MFWEYLSPNGKERFAGGVHEEDPRLATRGVVVDPEHQVPLRIEHREPVPVEEERPPPHSQHRGGPHPPAPGARCCCCGAGVYFRHRLRESLADRQQPVSGLVAREDDARPVVAGDVEIEGCLFILSVVPATSESRANHAHDVVPGDIDKPRVFNPSVVHPSAYLHLHWTGASLPPIIYRQVLLDANPYMIAYDGVWSTYIRANSMFHFCGIIRWRISGGVRTTKVDQIRGYKDATWQKDSDKVVV